MPRAGTTWLCRSLNQHPDVASFGETMFWGNAYVRPGRDGRYEARSLQKVRDQLLAKPFESTIAIPGPGALARVSAEDLPALISRGFDDLPPHSTPADAFLSVVGAVARAEGKPAWVEKTPHHIFYADRILEQLPTARFVVMVREPYSFMLSYKHQPGYLRTAVSRRRFERRYHPLACALVWRNSWRAARRLAHARPDRTLIVRMEDVEADPGGVMRKVQSFFELEEHAAVCGVADRINSSFDDGQRPALSDSDVAWMNLAAGREIEAANYRLLRQPNRTHALWKSLLELPGWSLRIHQDLRARTSTPLLRHLWRV